LTPKLSRPAAHALLHGIVLLWGCTAILGKQISISTIPLVWYRVVLVVIVLAGVVPLRGHALRLPWKVARGYFGVGAIIGIHWLCFYGAVKVAGVATGVLTLSTIAFFTALIEPLLFKRRVDARELVIGGCVVAGAALLLTVEVEAKPLGIVLGLASSLFAGWFGVMNGRLAHRGEPPERLMLYELTAAVATVSLCFVVVPAQFVAPWQLSGADLGWLVVLAVVCTVVPQVLILSVLRTLTPFVVAVATNLESVYSLILAAILFHDEPLTARFYLGAAVLFALVGLNAVRKARPTRAAGEPAPPTPPG
jgi:drug/metabolite transporter (DMT)-like permease